MKREQEKNWAPKTVASCVVECENIREARDMTFTNYHTDTHTHTNSYKNLTRIEWHMHFSVQLELGNYLWKFPSHFMYAMTSCVNVNTASIFLRVSASFCSHCLCSEIENEPYSLSISSLHFRNIVWRKISVCMWVNACVCVCVFLLLLFNSIISSYSVSGSWRLSLTWLLLLLLLMWVDADIAAVCLLG